VLRASCGRPHETAPLVPVALGQRGIGAGCVRVAGFGVPPLFAIPSQKGAAREYRMDEPPVNFIDAGSYRVLIRTEPRCFLQNYLPSASSAAATKRRAKRASCSDRPPKQQRPTDRRGGKRCRTALNAWLTIHADAYSWAAGVLKGSGCTGAGPSAALRRMVEFFTLPPEDERLSFLLLARLALCFEFSAFVEPFRFKRAKSVDLKRRKLIRHLAHCLTGNAKDAR
jgi:hypothetical protein